MRIDLDTFCRKTGMSITTARRKMKSGELHAVMKNGKYYVEFDDSPADYVGQREKLKDMLTAAQIKKITQSLNEGREEIKREAREEFKDAVLKALKPLADAYRGAKLTPEQAAAISAGQDEALKNMESL